MRDLKLIDPAQPRIPEEWRRQYQSRSPQQLAGDVTKLFDKNFMLEREKDRICRELAEAQKDLLRERKWRRWLMGALGASWVVAKLALPYVIRGALAH